ncbi:hypothetical protein AALC17_04085 [Oscillospiraceae bacterium 38-13]
MKATQDIAIKCKKEPPSVPNLAPVGVFYFAKTNGKKVERAFYFCLFGRKSAHFAENPPFSVEKKSLLFGLDFRILKNKHGGEKWGRKA